MYFARQAGPGSRSLLAQGVTVIDAGCGTGSTVIPLAKAYPQSQFLGVDMTPKSLEIAERDAKKQGVTNLSFAQADLQTFSLGRTFDVVLSFGVLVAIADPLLALERLTAHLAPEGRLIVWVYGTHGRYRLRQNQRMLALLTRRTDDWHERMAIGKRALSNLPRKHLECVFSVPSQCMEESFSASFDWVLGNESWLADQFLHPNERTYELEGILGLFDRVGVHLDHWIGVDTDIAKYTSDAELQAWVRELPERDRLRFLDLLLKPADYFVVARRGTAEK
jgi:SAM-dependent methyltransferase